MLPCKQVTTYLLEFQRINTLQTLHKVLILSIFVEGLFIFDHEQWRVRESHYSLS